MGGNKKQQLKKPSSSGSSSFSVFGMFKAKPTRSYTSRVFDDTKDHDYMKAYKVWPSDEDRGRWVAEPGIDRKASAYISTIQGRWKNTVEVAN